jgi:hypothetical protein
MKFAIKKQLIFAVLSCAVLVTMAGASLGQSPRVPDLPEECGRIRVPEGNRLAYHVYAKGEQEYWWNGTAWSLVAPAAALYADAGYQAKLGVHYGGPTWKSNSGGLVIGRRLEQCSPDATAIAWLMLYAFEVDGAGMFSDTSYIQRVNTAGGKAPEYPGASEGDRISVPYTAEYYFYRKIGSRQE